MMDMVVLAAFTVLHTVDGREIAINAEQVTSVTSGKDGESNKLLTDKVHCVVSLANGKFISVLEDCDAVLQKVGDPP
jgi:uncharacterized protein YlzI (FlbEa/FlbD family)